MLHLQIADLYRPFAEALIKWFNKLQKIHIFSPYPSFTLAFLHGTARNDVDALLWEKVKEEICPGWWGGGLSTAIAFTQCRLSIGWSLSQTSSGILAARLTLPTPLSDLSSPQPQETIGSLTSKFNSSSAANSTTIPKRIISIGKGIWDEQLM